MLALQQAYEIKASITAYLKATFDFRDPELEKAFDRFINDPIDGVFKGPYLSLKLPYEKATEYDFNQVPLVIKPDWLPYQHQLESWNRLSPRQDMSPQSTIVTTGTGSGKTEAFLYPILDYCLLQKDQPGIKAIILYPMNALATDQAKRIAEIIQADHRLKDQITAGLFIGLGKDNAKYPSFMGEDHIIENRNAILDSPPDILLTNFKMLDYGLMRDLYQRLWRHNQQHSSLLQYLVLDELHTYDGAQGTDVAHLIRRLKLKLSIERGSLCAVGTSATIGGGEESLEALTHFAQSLFGETIPKEAIILESRRKVDQFRQGRERDELNDLSPGLFNIRKSRASLDLPYQKYIEEQYRAWGLDPSISAVQLGEALKENLIFNDLLDICESGMHSIPYLVDRLSEVNISFRSLPDWDRKGDFNPREELIISLLSLVAQARGADGHQAPFVQIQVQLWVRELRRVLRVLDDEARFTWDSGKSQQEEKYGLPPWFCRECGNSGWIGLKHDNKNRLEKNISEIYVKFFENDKNIYFIQPSRDQAIDEYTPTDTLTRSIDPYSLDLSQNQTDDQVAIHCFRRINQGGHVDHVCPQCNGRNTVAIIGTRIPTLSSITVSQNLSTDLSDTPDRNRKVLAFTNSVQDAAHQASFIEARNYNFTFRTSLQQVINLQREPISLEKLTEEFLKFWKTQGTEDAFYFRFFPSDYIGKASPQNYQTKGTYDAAFVREFDFRMQWQVFAEFGFNALIGRTLEKTLSSGTFFEIDILSQVYEKMHRWLQENQLGYIESADFMSFLNLLLHRMRVRGTVHHAYLSKFRSEESTTRNLSWLNDSRHFLNPRYHPRLRLPKVVTTQSESKSLLDSTFATTTNWFHKYFVSCFPLGNTYLINEFYQQLFKTLTDVGLVDESYAKGLVNYAIDPDHILVSKDTVLYQCDQCGHKVFVSTEDRLVEKGKCLTYLCGGQYHAVSDVSGQNYYSKVYNRNRSPRIHASEHTGIIDRKSRELIESDFKERNRYDSINALVATSTLEMGIDIGTLNTAINNSIPPEPSNFLQRVGRAGRSSGSAVIINLSPGEDHDLYYFQQPKDMMEGEVRTPGCFLGAREMLRRHFFAYCLDEWSGDDPNENGIPNFIRDLKLLDRDLDDPSFFINRINLFIQKKERILLEKFEKIYVPELSTETFDDLKAFVQEGHLEYFLVRIFKRIQQEGHDIRLKRKEINSRIKAEKLAKGDPLRLELEMERKNLSRLWKTITSRSVLEHMTNVGALPNYAFPETGVTLNATILPYKDKEQTYTSRAKDYEFVRPASQAVRELAPDNKFYAQGYAFEVSGLDVFSWSETGNLIERRYCSACDHMSIKSTQYEQEPCPKCGDESFGSASNVHKFVDLQSVRSVSNQLQASITDTRDDRDEQFYHISRHFDFHDAVSSGSYAIEDVSFGIEFLREVEMFEVNLGSIKAVDARKTTINHFEVPNHGFITCRHCGKSSSNPRKKDHKFHFGYCKYRDQDYQGKPDEVFEEVFLMRHFKTEVLRILIPALDINLAADKEIFKSGLRLGLQRHFKGNPAHIRFFEYSEYNLRKKRQDHYIILLDSIPGGTSYLENIFDEKIFSSIIATAYQEIQQCSCQFEGKDGCYRCIYSYGNKYVRNDLSRSRAEKLFQRIDQQLDGWRYRNEGLGNVITSGNVVESQLEELFIFWLRTLSRESDELEFEEIRRYDQIHYQLSIDQSGKTQSLSIIPQVNLGPAQGVAYSTRPDFLISLNTDDVNIPEIAVYLDGYQFHATQTNMRFSDDVRKRLAIRHGSGRPRLTWTLTWSDFELASKKLDEPDLLNRMATSARFAATSRRLRKQKRKRLLPFHKGCNNLGRLLDLLYGLSNFQDVKDASGFFLGSFQEILFSPSYPISDLHLLSDLSQDLDRNEMYINSPEAVKTGLSLFQGPDSNTVFHSRSFVDLHTLSLHSIIQLLPTPSDLVKEDWEYFWILFNVLQLHEDVRIFDPQDRKSQSEEWNEFFEIYEYSSDYRDLIMLLHDRKYFKLGDEESELKLTSLQDENGSEIAIAQLIINTQKIAFEPANEMSRRNLEKMGYKIEDISQFDLNSIQ